MPTDSPDFLRIRGARTHNLRNIDLDLPRQKLVVITGPSGSGKSSLAFDTLYAEGQRRYVESLSVYARQFLQLMEKPAVDLIEGLSPAIAIQQKSGSHNPRSTVGTITEIHDHLRLLFARAGVPHCPEHRVPLHAHSISEMVDTVLAGTPGRPLAILAPLPLGSGPSLTTLQAQGFVRVRIDGEMLELSEPELPQPQHSLEVVVDRLRVKPDIRQRLAESFETAMELAHGRALLCWLDDNSTQAFSIHHACPHCDYRVSALEPALFSFNSPMGACPSCDGLGEVYFFDPAKVVSFPELSLASGAIRGWDRRNSFYFQMLSALAAHYAFDLETPYEQLKPAVQQVLLYGSGNEEIAFTHLTERGRSKVQVHPFEGILPNLERRWRETDSAAVREELSKFRSVQVCPDCGGTRLRQEARHVLLGQGAQQRGIADLEHLPLEDAQAWFASLELRGARAEIGARLVHEIRQRLRFLNDVGLPYLTLARPADTLSGGEAQRIRLASQIGSGLTGVLYVLDEPSIGLHQRDNERLIATLEHLRDLGNTVIVVEHDEDMIRRADWVVDMGPAAGEHGGQVMAQGKPAAILQNPDSITGRYLAGALKTGQARLRRVPPVPESGPLADSTGWLSLLGARGNNLQNVDLRVPLGRLVCVSGLSGSGKSTLVNDTLVPALSQRLHRAQTPAAPFDHLLGIEQIDKIIAVDQSPIGRTPRSNPATYIGLFTPIRELFAGVPEARARGYDAGRFSFNVKGGRCEACQGDGLVKVEMHFLPDVYVPCDVCHGKRYNRETLEIRYRGLNVAEVLELTVEQAAKLFEAVPALHRRLQTLLDVGLGYLRLGQSATTLSGGEAQRVKLAHELSRRDTGRTLYVLDEPTTGLHFHDIALLLQVLQQLVDAGNTVLVIEHNLDVLRCADWIIDLGPEGGRGGGRIVAQGTPTDLATHPHSVTGPYLREPASSGAQARENEPGQYQSVR